MSGSIQRVAPAVCALLAIAVTAGTASAAPVTLFSTFNDANAVDPNGLVVSGAPPDPAQFGLRFNFNALAPVAEHVRLDLVNSIVFALSTTETWATPPSIYVSLFADKGGTPAAPLAHSFVYWPLTSAPTLFPTHAGPLSTLLFSTKSDYWLTLSLINGDDGSFYPDRTMTWHYAAGTTTAGVRLIGTPIPEPPSVVLTVLGCAGLLALRVVHRHRRRQS